MVDVLNDYGYDAVGATNGREALARLRASAALPCLILLDLMMPVMDGRGFREAQLLDHELAKIPVVVVSAYGNSAKHAEELGAVAHLDKPLKLATLLQLIERFC